MVFTSYATRPCSLCIGARARGDGLTVHAKCTCYAKPHPISDGLIEQLVLVSHTLSDELASYSTV